MARDLPGAGVAGAKRRALVKAGLRAKGVGAFSYHECGSRPAFRADTHQGRGKGGRSGKAAARE